MVTEPNELFDYLYSSEFEVSDARLVNDETVVVLCPLFGEISTQGAWTWRAAWTPRGFDAINFLPP